MKKIFFLLFTASLFFGIHFQSASANSSMISHLSGTSTENKEEETETHNLFKNISDLFQFYSQQDEILKKLEDEKNRSFETEKEEIDKLEKQISYQESRIVELKKETPIDDVQIGEIDKRLLEIRKNLTNHKEILHEKTEVNLAKIKELEEELITLNEEIDRTWSFLLENLLRVALLLFIVILLLVLKFISGKAIEKFSGNMALQRKNALIRINKIIFNVLIALVIFITISSNLVSIIPLLAILGTALAFALRDVITSFIGWFVIGAGQQGYKIGDLIEIGSLRGRVLEIHPLLTILKQTGMRGDTGRIMTIPNKTIFEEKILNFSKIYKFYYIMLDFILEPDSNIEKAKKALEESMYENNEEGLKSADAHASRLFAKFNIKKENLKPKIFVETDMRGILLRGKFICNLDDRFRARSDTSEAFFKKIQKMKDVKLRLVNFGEVQAD